MDAHHFDDLVRSLRAAGTRRGLLGLLASVPLFGGLAALLADEESLAKDRRRRRKQRHKRRTGKHKSDEKGKRKHKKKGCTPESVAQTCAGKCGPVANTCQQAVDCGPCDCDPPCGACETCSDARVCEPCDSCCDDVCCPQANAICHATTGACCVPDSTAQTCTNQCGDIVNTCGDTVDCGPCTCEGGCPACQVCDDNTGGCIADPQQQGDDCGEAGQVCHADGACACAASSCPACRTCGPDGACQACSGCCDGETCVTDCGDCRVCEQGQCAPGCAACEICQGDGSCSEPCGGEGCCANGTCADGTDDGACGRNGESCLPCSLPDTCGGGGVPGECGCTAKTCTELGKNCGMVPDDCSGMIDCGTCSGFDTCGGGGTPNVCGCTPNDPCTAGVCGTVSNDCGTDFDCGGCSGGTPFCVANTCVACQTSADCELGFVCDATQHVCRSCVNRFECVPQGVFRVQQCEPLFDGSGQSRCTDFDNCICPGACADCGSGRLCFRTVVGGPCANKNLCCPPTPAL